MVDPSIGLLISPISVQPPLPSLYPQNTGSFPSPSPHTPNTPRQSIGNKGTAQTAWEKSCYFKIDFKIPEDAMMYEAVQK
jgi:hypothetical protein